MKPPLDFQSCQLNKKLIYELSLETNKQPPPSNCESFFSLKLFRKENNLQLLCIDMQIVARSLRLELNESIKPKLHFCSLL